MKPLKYVRFLSLMALAVAVLCGGCSKPKRQTGVVRGKVVYGEKMVAGNVRFVNENGDSGEGVIYDDGTYEVAEAPVGKCKVSLVTEHLEKREASPGSSMGKMAMKDRPTAGPGAGGQSKPPAEAQAKMGKPPVGGESQLPPTTHAPNGLYIPIPKKYKSPDSSGLEFDVQTGQNSYDIELK